MIWGRRWREGRRECRKEGGGKQGEEEEGSREGEEGKSSGLRERSVKAEKEECGGRKG